MAALELLGCLIAVVSIWMFASAHRQHAQLTEVPTFSNAHHRQQQRQHVLYVDDKIYRGEEISDMIRGALSFPVDHQLRFRPGSLAISSVETVQHCYVDMNLYKEHFDQLFAVQVSVSEKYKLIYRNIPKSASSSSRKVMQDYFDGKDTRMKHYQLNAYVLKQNYTLISFIRDPLDRFYSSYDEAFLRMGPWWGSESVAKEKPALYKHYISNKHKVARYPYLYEGMKTIDDFRKAYCPKNLLEQKDGHLQCVESDTIDDGSLTRRFEQFVQDYDGSKPFDNHLRLQVPFLVYNFRSNGAPLPVSAIYNASEANAGWRTIAGEKGVIIPNDGMSHGRKSSRRFNVDLVSDVTKRKICQMLALDYCCLNLELPDVCKSADKDSEVFCSLEQKTVKDQKGEQYDKVVIQSHRSYS